MIHFDGKIPIVTPKVDNIVPISILPELDHHMKILSEITQLHELYAKKSRLECVSGFAKLILGSIWYLNHETEHKNFDRHFMFEKSDAHIVTSSLTRFSDVDLYFGRQSEP